MVFQDEVHFKAQSTVTRKWAKRGSEPKVMSKPGRDSICYSGYLIPSTGRLFLAKPARFSYLTVIESMRVFLKLCPPPKGKKYLIVLDNAPWHKKAARIMGENEGNAFDGILALADFEFLPPYSPDLNPIEQVWRKTRRERTHNRYFESAKELRESLDEYFGRFEEGSEELKSLCSFKCFENSEAETNQNSKI